MFGFVLACQQAGASGSLKVERLWARASLAGVRNGIVFGQLVDESDSPLEVMGASTPVADHVEFHEDSMNAGVMSMRQLDSIQLKPGQVLTLQPGGMHFMLVDLRGPLRAGESFPLTLRLADGKSVAAIVTVLGATAAAP